LNGSKGLTCNVDMCLPHKVSVLAKHTAGDRLFSECKLARFMCCATPSHMHDARIGSIAFLCISLHSLVEKGHIFLSVEK